MTTESSITEQMLIIKHFDPSASVCLSLKNSWYVASTICIHEGSTETTCAQFCDSPEEAVSSFLKYLANKCLFGGPTYFVARPHGKDIRYQYCDGQFVAAVVIDKSKYC